ncbi:MAG TPA: peptidylprolyl isomerase [Pyrinomonadaceae bacterium]|nr:peptidylprolyl isomerase [Pyrinomonadaceae bacterium]
MNRLLGLSLIVIITLFTASPVLTQKRSARPARKKAAEPTDQNKSEAPLTIEAPIPTPTPTPVPTPTPQPTPGKEPFDDATVEKMSAQCVSLETEKGSIVLKMLPESAPETVRNFLNLTAIGAFDTTTFSRVVKDFVIQGGNLSTSEKLTPALAERSKHTIPDEPNRIKHLRGIASMARPDAPDSATTNFFILVKDAIYLDGTYSPFARVVNGIYVADEINQMPVEDEKPVKPVRLKRAFLSSCPAEEENAQ